MEFYQVNWVDHHGAELDVIIPYSEIVAFKKTTYKQIDKVVYTPITRSGGYDYRSLEGEEGLKHYQAWKEYKKNQS
jgi:hypothetical protein